MNRHGKRHPDLASEDQTSRILIGIGQRIRELRKDRGMTLQALAEASGVSSSMLSLVERALATPSIESLIQVGEALSINIANLFEIDDAASELVVRADDAEVIRTDETVIRRILRNEAAPGVSIEITDILPGADWFPAETRPSGFTHGLVIEGELAVEVDGRSYALSAGDLISFASIRQSRISNASAAPVRTVWLQTD